MSIGRLTGDDYVVSHNRSEAISISTREMDCIGFRTRPPSMERISIGWLRQTCHLRRGKAQEKVEMTLRNAYYD